MGIVRLTKEFRYEGAHALMGYDGKCRHIHGHSYILYVTVKGIPSSDIASPKCGMLLDFTELKKIVNEAIVFKFDHALTIREGAPLIDELKAQYDNIIVLPFQPTCENLVIHFAELLSQKLPKEVKLFSLKLYETATSYVEWFAEEN